MTDWDKTAKNVDEALDDMIELTDIVDGPSPGANGEIIDLMDIVDEKPDLNLDFDNVEELEIQPVKVKEEEPDLDLEMIKEEPVHAIEDFDDDLELEEPGPEAMNMADAAVADVAPNVASMVDGMDAGRDHEAPAGFQALSPEQIETALEKVIEKKFAAQIQSILFQVMERVIEKEISEIRESLQKDLDQIGNV